MTNWPLSSLKGKISIRHGFPFKSEFFSDEETDFIVLTPGNFYEEGGFKRQAGKEKFYTGEVPEEYLHEAGDLIVAMTEQAAGLLGSCARVPESGIYLHNQRLGRITTDSKKILRDYAYHLFKTKTVREQIRLTSSGSKVKHTSPERIYDVKVPLPTVPEQQKIVDLLDAIETKIELNNRINTELEAMAKTLYDYWFVQFDFPDANGKPYKTSGGKMVYNPTLKRKIPEGWEVKKLVDVTFIIRRGISPKYTEEGGISVLNQKCIRDQRISFEDSRRHQIELDDEDERLLKPFDVVVNSTGVGTLGRVAYVKRLLEKKTTVDSHVSIVRANPELVSPQYLAWKLMRHQPVIESAANGSTGQVELSKSFLEDIDVIIPAEQITPKFNAFINSISAKLAVREPESEQLVKLRDWLLPMLMNGQVTVK